MSERNIQEEIILAISAYQNQGHPEAIQTHQLSKIVKVNSNELNKILTDLKNRGLIDLIRISDDEFAVWLTPSGKKYLSENSYTTSSSVIQIESIKLKQKTYGSQTQQTGLIFGKEILQVINDDNNRREFVESSIKQLIDTVRNELAESELNRYTEITEILREQLLDRNPDPTIVQKALKTLGFFGDIEGTLALIYRVWPLLAPLIPIVIDKIK